MQENYYDAEFETFPEVVQIEISQNRVDLLIDEIYNEDKGGFMGFFQ